jgi:hypothetical protein
VVAPPLLPRILLCPLLDNVPAMSQVSGRQSGADWPRRGRPATLLGPLGRGSGLGPTCPSLSVEAHGDTFLYLVEFPLWSLEKI